MKEATPQSGVNPFAPPKTVFPKQKMRRYQKAGSAIRIIAMLASIFTALATLALVLPQFTRNPSVPLTFGDLVALFVAGVLCAGLFSVARAVIRHESWGHIAGIACGLLSLLGFPIGTMIGAYILYNLTFGWDDPESPPALD